MSSSPLSPFDFQRLEIPPPNLIGDQSGEWYDQSAQMFVPWVESSQTPNAVAGDLSPQPLGDQQSAIGHAPFNRAFARTGPGLVREQLRCLQMDYALVGDDDAIIEALMEFPALYLLLKDAVEPLRLAFGEKKLLQLEALESDDDQGVILRVTVKLPSKTERPADLMRGFKRNWWIKHCSRSEASLVFDYETGDAF